MRKAIGSLAALGVISLSTAAFAQGYSAGYSGGYRGGYAPPVQSSTPVDNIGNQGQFVLGAERLTALSFDSVTSSQGGQSATQKATGIALLGNSVGAGGMTMSSLPRFGFDYFVIDGLSLGTSLTYAHMSQNLKQGSNSQDLGSQDVFLFAPRIGYALQFGDTFSFWPRAGITYANISTSTPASAGQSSSSTSTHFLDLTVEPLFGISPVSHFVILGGPYLDLGLSGSTKIGSQSVDQKATSFGLTFGIAGYI